MDTVVYKYPIPIADTFTLELPESALLLTVVVQGDDHAHNPDVQLWALVDPAARSERRGRRIEAAARLKRNTYWAPDKNLEGEWVCIPKEDFDNLAAALDARPAVGKGESDGRR